MEGRILANLYKKVNINYNGKVHEIFVFRDAVAGFYFKNTENNEVFHIVTGNWADMLANVLNENGNNSEDVVVLKSNEEALKLNDSRVEFSKIREKVIKESSKYYICAKGKLSVLLDKKLIAAIDLELGEDKNKSEIDISKMYNSIKQLVLGQDNQIKQILTSIFKNQKVANSNLDIDTIARLKENILIFGALGYGEMEILKYIAKSYNVPLVTADALSLSEGEQRENIKKMLEELYAFANSNKNTAEKGILVINNFDKLVDNSNVPDPTTLKLEIQKRLLKLLDGEPFYLSSDKCLDTSKLTIVALGEFQNISAAKDTNHKEVGVKNFKSIGMMEELMIRFSNFIEMSPLTKEDIIRTLVESKLSPLNTYKKLFETMKIELQYNEDFVNWLAETAIQSECGLRTLKTVFDKYIGEIMFDILAGKYASISLVEPKSNEEKPYTLNIR